MADTDKSDATEVIPTASEDTTEEKSSSIEDKDYEALEKEESGRTPDLKKAGDAFKNREEKREKAEVTPLAGGTPLTEERLLEILDTRDATSTKSSNEERALEIARKNTTSEAAARAALAFWKNRVQPTGNLEEDVLFAIGGMERKVQAAKNAELARALKGKDTTITDFPTTGAHFQPQAPAPKLNGVDAASYARAGFVLDQQRKLYIKTLPNGKKLIKDPVSKRQWTE